MAVDAQLLFEDVVASTAVNEQNQGAILTVTVGLCTTCVLVFFLARLLIRWPWRHLFGKDDTAIAVATVVLPKHTLQHLLVY